MRHVTHLLTKYVHGQLRASQRAQVNKHTRACVECRLALAQEEQLAADLRREMPKIGQPQPGQLAKVWAGVWQEVSAPPRHHRITWNWLPGLSAMTAVILLAVFIVPLITMADVSSAADAPLQPRPQEMAFATSTPPKITDEAPGVTPTANYEGQASPVPVPQEAASPHYGG